MNRALAMAALSLFGMQAPAQADAVDDIGQGQAVYEARCMRCHAISANYVGPRHQGVVGRKAGSVADFAYSAALKNASIVWTEDMLDRWLTNPEALIPGQEMDVQVKSAEERRLVIAYLKSQSATPGSPPAPVKRTP
jgi:cytochrome c